MKTNIEFPAISPESVHEYGTKAAFAALGQPDGTVDVLAHSARCVDFVRGFEQGFRLAEITGQLQRAILEDMKHIVGKRASPEVEAELKSVLATRAKDFLEQVSQHLNGAL